jgi:hypothetical protein
LRTFLPYLSEIFPSGTGKWISVVMAVFCSRYETMPSEIFTMALSKSAFVNGIGMASKDGDG